MILNNAAGMLDLYSLRHSFQAAMEVADVTVKQQKQLIGHKLEIHERYGAANLAALSKTVSRLQIVSPSQS